MSSSGVMPSRRSARAPSGITANASGTPASKREVVLDRSPLVGVTLKIPLQNRKAKGKLAETQAKIDELTVKQQFLAEKIRAEVTAIGLEVETANQLVVTSGKEWALAQRLAAAERRRFELGSSDFFLVNQREESATNAEIKLIEAQARIAAAKAELAAATADEDALGLTPS